MSKDQQIVVTRVYQRFCKADAEETSWTDIDEQMCYLEYIDDPQTVIEAAVILQLHLQGDPRCEQDHPREECFIPLVIDAATAIIDLYGKTGNLHPKNKFILQYYLALSQVGYIVY